MEKYVILISQWEIWQNSFGVVAIECTLHCSVGGHLCICMCQGNKGTEKHPLVAYLKTNCTADSLKILYETTFHVQQ